MDQNNATVRNLICWYGTPPQVSAGGAAASAKYWPGKVIFLCEKHLGSFRKQVGWEDCDYPGVEIIYLSDVDNPTQCVADIVKNNPHAIHFYSGMMYQGKSWHLLERYVMPEKDTPILLGSELPGIWGNWYKKILRFCFLGIKNRIIVHKYAKRINALLPYGVTGVRKFHSYGWPLKQLFPYMYCPRFQFLPPPPPRTGDTVRFVYIGRFRFSTKGVDLLMKAFDALTGKNWTLDLVGGHGEQREQVISWAEHHPQVTFKGFCPSHEITTLLQNYDVAIVPSRFDGWNPIPNEAAAAGIGVIASDAAVSDEITFASGAGLVFPAGNYKALQQCIETVLNKPQLSEEWKQKIVRYRDRVSPETVGKYLNQILQYVADGDLSDLSSRPECPWLSPSQQIHP